MTDLKFNILKLLYYTYPIREMKKGDIINSIPDNPLLIENSLKELQSEGYIEVLLCTDKYRLIPSGATTFEKIQEDREQAAKKEKQQRFDNKVSIASVLVPFITF